MTDASQRGPAGDGSLLDRLRRRARARGSARAARAAVTGLIASPPGDLAAVERLTGPLDVDMEGPEGHGAGVFRPESPFAPGGATGGIRLGRLRPGISRVAVVFAWDPYHGQPRDPRLLRPESMSLSVELDRLEVLRRLEQAFGAGRAIDDDGRTVLEFGRWYYLSPWHRPASLAWHERRPDWAVPVPRADAVEALLASLGTALREASDAAAIAAALAASCEGTGATISGSDGLLIVTARPGLPITGVARVLGMQRPVAWSTDVHMTRWTVTEDTAGQGTARGTRVGSWAIEMRLERAPRGAPVLDRGGPSSTYDLRGREDPIVELTARLES
jgi:hypothetical protein